MVLFYIKLLSLLKSMLRQQMWIQQEFSPQFLLQNTLNINNC